MCRTWDDTDYGSNCLSLYTGASIPGGGIDINCVGNDLIVPICIQRRGFVGGVGNPLPPAIVPAPSTSSKYTIATGNGVEIGTSTSTTSTTSPPFTVVEPIPDDTISFAPNVTPFAWLSGDVLWIKCMIANYFAYTMAPVQANLLNWHVAWFDNRYEDIIKCQWVRRCIKCSNTMRHMNHKRLFIIHSVYYSTSSSFIKQSKELQDSRKRTIFKAVEITADLSKACFDLTACSLQVENPRWQRPQRVVEISFYTYDTADFVHCYSSSIFPLLLTLTWSSWRNKPQNIEKPSSQLSWTIVLMMFEESTTVFRMMLVLKHAGLNW